MKKKMLLGLAIGTLIFFMNGVARATFIQYSDESSWRTAAGATVLEDFESYSPGDTFSSLPALGVGFMELEGGGFPNIYSHNADVTPYGRKHLGNFPNGINPTNQWDDITMYVLPGYTITSVGFWNGDGQSDTLVATAYDVNGGFLGSIGAYKGRFAGFVSDVAISRVVFNGNTGDGWNHLDGLQTNANASAAVPEPATILLFATGIAGLTGARIKRKKK